MLSSTRNLAQLFKGFVHQCIILLMKTALSGGQNYNNDGDPSSSDMYLVARLLSQQGVQQQPNQKLSAT
jgi:hypothetical protein